VIKPIIFKAPNERVRKSVVIKPILPKAPNERCQLDLIDMQNQSDDGFKWILVYQVLSTFLL
jgi:hypothetical protein